VQAGKLEEAEAAARDLIARYPEVHDGWDRLGMMYEAKGEKKAAADCYRKVVEIIRERPEQYDPEFADAFVELVDKLDPPTAGPPAG
jgi:predicted TPR repeat methyltransferase